MSIEKAQQWLQNHSHIVPALTVNQQEIVRLSENDRHANQLVKIAIRDPGFSLALLIKVNQTRGPQSAKDIVESPLAAISLLGDHVSHTLFKKFTLAEQTLQQTHQLFLFQQLINRCLHNEVQAEMWGEQLGFKNIEPVKVAAVLAYSGEILCCVHDFERYLEYVQAGSSEKEAERIFGFQFPQLTDALCSEFNLPLTIIQSLPHQLHDGQTAQLLFHTRQVCRFCERGWLDDSTQDAFKAMGEWLQMPLDNVVQKTYQHAIQAARSTFVPEAWQPAARLLLLQDQVWGTHLKPAEKPVDKPAEEPPVAASVGKQQVEQQAVKPPTETRNQPTATGLPVIETIKQMVSQPATTQSELVNTCLKGLFKDLDMSRVSLLLLSKDKTNLQNRMSLGLDQQSPFRQFSIEVNKAGLLKALLNKPQAIWINQDSLKKYQQHLPQSLMASLMTDNFLAMSLFIAEKPIGIVYADRSNTPEKIDLTVFSQFKQLITLTSKALTLLSKR